MLGLFWPQHEREGVFHRASPFVLSEFLCANSARYSLALKLCRPYTLRHEPCFPHRPPSAFPFVSAGCSGRPASGRACKAGATRREARRRGPAPEAAAGGLAASALPPLPPQDDPWLYSGSDVPHDKEWAFGTLENGLRWAVRANSVPPGQVSIRIRMDVGSLYEKPEEAGYAHLIEHLVFRQSKYLGQNEAIPTWQRLGATLGSDTNAETSSTATVFKIDLPNATPQTWMRASSCSRA
jgi:hypothetical protein